MRKIDFYKAKRNTNDVWVFCDELGIDAREYWEEIMTGEEAINYIKNECEEYLKEDNLDGLYSYLEDQYLPSWYDTCHLNDDNDVRYFGDYEFNGFCDIVADYHCEDDDWEEDDDDEEKETEEKPSSYEEMIAKKAEASEKAFNALKKLFKEGV